MIGNTECGVKLRQLTCIITALWALQSVDTYSYSTVYDHFGGYYYYDSSNWEMNGYSNYIGESNYDTSDYSFAGWYSYQDDNSYRWNNENYIYKGEGRTTYTNTRWVTESADYEYSNGPDYYYKSSVLEPLVMDYTCTSPMMYLAGMKAQGEDANRLYVMTDAPMDIPAMVCLTSVIRVPFGAMTSPHRQTSHSRLAIRSTEFTG